MEWTTKLAVACLVGALGSAAHAITLSDVGTSIDFDPSTFTFTNWQMGSVNQLAASGISYTGWSLDPASQQIFAYNDDANTMPGLVGYSILGAQGSMVVIAFSGDMFTSALTVLQTTGALNPTAVSISADFDLGGTNDDSYVYTSDATASYVKVTDSDWVAQHTNSAVVGFFSQQQQGGPVLPLFTQISQSVAYTLDYTFPGNAHVILNSQFVISTQPTIIPEPLSAATGMLGLAAIGLFATRRRRMVIGQ